MSEFTTEDKERLALLIKQKIKALTKTGRRLSIKSMSSLKKYQDLLIKVETL